MVKRTICVNLFAGPGAGKSTISTGVFSKIKQHDINSEYTGEYAKKLAWQDRLKLRRNDFKIFAEQHNYQFMLDGKVDVIVSDSPLLLSSIYRKPFDSLFHALVVREFKRYDNMNYFIKRTKPYIQKGRKQNKTMAERIDDETIEILEKEQLKYKILLGDTRAINKIVKDVLERLNTKVNPKVMRS